MNYLIIYTVCYITAFSILVIGMAKREELSAHSVTLISVISLGGPAIILLCFLYTVAGWIAKLLNKLLRS
jgi:hypothetical protein